jgi:hypothetical protein
VALVRSSIARSFEATPISAPLPPNHFDVPSGGVRFEDGLLAQSPEQRNRPILGLGSYCVITIAAVRVSGIVTDDTRLVSGG